MKTDFEQFLEKIVKPVKKNIEYPCEAFKITENKIMVRIGGIWIELKL